MIPIAVLVAFQLASTSNAQASAGIQPSWDGVLVTRQGRIHKVRGDRGFGARPDSTWTRRVRDSLGQVPSTNWIGRLQEDPTLEPFYPDQWALANTGQEYGGVTGLPGADIGAAQAWRTTSGDSSVVVAFLDGGVDPTHPELQGQLARNLAEAEGVSGKDDDGNGFVDDSVGWDFVRRDGKVRDVGGHGTSTASVVVARWNGLGLAGLAPRVRLLPIRVADGGSRVSLQNLVDGLDYAVNRKARVVNLSLGGLPSPDLLDSAIARAVRAGCAVVVSAGNEGLDLDVSPRYPAASRIPGMIVVGASDARDRPSSYTNHSPKLVDLSAPGDALVAASIPEPDTLWTEAFESGLAGWTTGGTGTAWGTESVLGSTRLSDSPGRNYPKSTRRWIRSPRLNPSGRSGLLLSLSMRGRVNGSDYFLVECARDSGFAKVDDTLFLNGAFHQDTATEMVLDAGSVDGSPFSLRFTLVSDGLSSTSDSGVEIDDLVLRARDLPQPPGGAYARVWGTSFSAPLTTAALGLLASLHPDARPESLVQAVASGAQVVATLAGASRTGARLWVPGALRSSSDATATGGRVAVPGGLRVRPGRFDVDESGAWSLAWRDLRGRNLGRVAGTGPGSVPFAASGPVLWTLRSGSRTFSGMVMPR